MDDFNNKGDILLERLRLSADGKTKISLFREFNHTALDVIAAVIYLLKTYKQLF